MGDEEERRERAYGLVGAMQQKAEADRAVGALALGMMGLDPREILGEDE